MSNTSTTAFHEASPVAFAETAPLCVKKYFVVNACPKNKVYTILMYVGFGVLGVAAIVYFGACYLQARQKKKDKRQKDHEAAPEGDENLKLDTLKETSKDFDRSQDSLIPLASSSSSHLDPFDDPRYENAPPPYHPPTLSYLPPFSYAQDRVEEHRLLSPSSAWQTSDSRRGV